MYSPLTVLGGGGIRLRAQIGEIIQGFTVIFRGFDLFFMVSGSPSSKELNNAIKSQELPLGPTAQIKF